MPLHVMLMLILFRKRHTKDFPVSRNASEKNAKRYAMGRWPRPTHPINGPPWHRNYNIITAPSSTASIHPWLTPCHLELPPPTGGAAVASAGELPGVVEVTIVVGEPLASVVVSVVSSPEPAGEGNEPEGPGDEEERGRSLVELAGIILPLDVITHPEGSEPMGVMVVVLEPRPMPPTGTVGEFVVDGWAAVAVNVGALPLDPALPLILPSTATMDCQVPDMSPHLYCLPVE